MPYLSALGNKVSYNDLIKTFSLHLASKINQLIPDVVCVSELITLCTSNSVEYGDFW